MFSEIVFGEVRGKGGFYEDFLFFVGFFFSGDRRGFFEILGFLFFVFSLESRKGFLGGWVV